MGYLLALSGLVILFVIFVILASHFLGSGPSRTVAGRSSPHKEKEQMDKPQEEFIDDGNSRENKTDPH